MSGTDRRSLLKIAAVGAVGASSLSLAGRSVTAQETTTIRYGWWGGAERQQNYTAALEGFEAENPDIEIAKEFADYTPFQERMTTQIAAGDVPDIFWIASPQVLTYENAGLYHSLEDIPTLDLSDLDEGILETIRLNGELNTMPNGIFAPVVRYNETFATEDGVELPSQENGEWTWDNFAEFLIDYNESNSSGRRGIAYDATADLPFEAWCRQHGEQLWAEDGTMGWSLETLIGWFEWWENLRQSGAALSVSEQEGVDADFQLVGETVLCTFNNSNHIVDDAKMFPDYTLRMREVPVMDGAEEGHKYLYYPRMAIYSGIDPEKVEAAGSIVNYIINDVRFVETTGLTMGAPINPRIRAAAYDFATDAEIEMLNFVEAEAAAPSRPRYEAPAGSNNWRTVMTRTAEEIALEQSSVADACERMMDEIAAEIERAQ